MNVVILEDHGVSCPLKIAGVSPVYCILTCTCYSNCIYCSVQCSVSVSKHFWRHLLYDLYLLWHVGFSKKQCVFFNTVKLHHLLKAIKVISKNKKLMCLFVTSENLDIFFRKHFFILFFPPKKAKNKKGHSKPASNFKKSDVFFFFLTQNTVVSYVPFQMWGSFSHEWSLGLLFCRQHSITLHVVNSTQLSEQIKPVSKRAVCRKDR